MSHTHFLKDKSKKKDKKHLGRVATLPCVVCGNRQVEVHHKCGAGMALKSSDYDTIALCTNHHRGQDGIHRIGVKDWEDRYGTQDYFINIVKDALQVE